MDLSEIRQLHAEVHSNLSESYRNRILTYGPDAARLLLRLFDDLGEYLRDYGERPEDLS